MKTQDKRLAGIITFISILLLIPLIAMQFSSDVFWSVRDFIIAGVLLFGTGFILEFILRKVKTKRNRLLLGALVLSILLIVWIEIAVGLFGSPIAGT